MHVKLLGRIKPGQSFEDAIIDLLLADMDPQSPHFDVLTPRDRAELLDLYNDGNELVAVGIGA